MSIFSETMKKTISIYRGMLRKYLPQAERITKLHQLNLKNHRLYENEIALFHTGHLIVADIEKNLNQSSDGYYAYSGVASFCEHLKNFLANYTVEGNVVVHRSQKASRALIQAIQLLGLPREKLTAELTDRLSKCNKTIAAYGSEDQHEFHRETLRDVIRKQQEHHAIFYQSILNNFQQQIKENRVIGN